jgi:hypothetical protein
MSAARGHSRAISGSARLALIFLAAASSAASAQQTGVIAAVVRSGPDLVANARAILDTTRQARTDAEGRFELTGVAPGLHRLVVLAIGARPYDVNLVVTAADTLRFDISLERVVMLDSVLVEGSTVRQQFARAFEDRKRVGLGRFIDSLQVRSFALVPQAVSFVPGVKYKNGKILFGVYECSPNVWIDNVNWGTDQDVLKTTAPRDIMAVEVYTRDLLIPEEFRARGFEQGCGALVVWTRRLWPQGRGKDP